MNPAQRIPEVEPAAPPPERDAPALAFPRHLYLLDALRGVAALSVVLWHWQYLFFRGPRPVDFESARQPFFPIFRLLYTHGWRAVDLFFCLSGFIFFWLYAEKIARRSVSLRQFGVLRLSRLYPLHLATLLLAAALQCVLRRTDGQDFVFLNNGAWEFVRQCLMASSWGRGENFSFNAPVWSVSVEVLLYALFFVLCVVGWRRWWQLLLLVCAGPFLVRHGYPMPGRGVLSFFVGGLMFQLCRALIRRGLARRAAPWFGGVALLLWLCAPLLLRPGRLAAVFQNWHLHWEVHGKDLPLIFLHTMSQWSPELALYPLTILTLALWEAGWRVPGKRLAFLGQISYSAYLLHFPMIMGCVVAVRWLAVPTAIFYSPVALALFFAVLVALSLASFHWFELPCQTWLRARLLPGGEAKA